MTHACAGLAGPGMRKKTPLKKKLQRYYNMHDDQGENNNPILPRPLFNPGTRLLPRFVI